MLYYSGLIFLSLQSSGLCIWDPEQHAIGYTEPMTSDEEYLKWQKWYESQPKRKYMRTYPDFPMRAGGRQEDIDRTFPIVLSIFGGVIGFLVLVAMLVMCQRKCAGQHRAQLVAPDMDGYEPDYDTSWTQATPILSGAAARENIGWDRENVGQYVAVVTARCLKVTCDYQEQMGSDGAIWNVGFASGRHVWAFMWPRDQRIYYEAHISVGIGYPFEMQSEYGRMLVGNNRRSIGFNVITNSLYFDGFKVHRYPKHKSPSYCLPTLIYMYVDFDKDKLCFGSEDEFWDLAADFGEMRRGKDREHPLFPMVSFRKVYGKFMMFYKGQVPEETGEGAMTSQGAARIFEPATMRHLADIPHEQPHELQPRGQDGYVNQGASLETEYGVSSTDIDVHI